MEEYHLIKLIIIGDSGVGKSSLLSMYSDQIYNDNYMGTVGVDFKFKMVHVNNKKIKLQIWDTAGQERFRSITLSHYRGAHAIMLVFDLTNIYTFTKLTQWIKEVKTSMQHLDYEMILVGNKVDNTQLIQVNKNDIDNFVSAHKIEYIEVSAKNNLNIDEAFLKIINNVVKNTNIISDKKQETINLKGQKMNNISNCC